MFDRRPIQYFDWGLLALTLLLGAIGIATIYSAVTAGAPNPQKTIYYKQMIWFGAGAVLLLLSLLVSYKNLERWGLAIYLICIFLLVWVLLFGHWVGGSRRWLLLGPVSLQPSELVKVAVIIMLARYYAKMATPRGFVLHELFRPAAITLIPFVLIVRQPDLGTALLVVMIAATITMFVKIERRSLLFLMAVGVATVLGGWFLLKGYQKQRILTFLDPDRDPLGAGYHIIQSKIAIGSGMLSGKGYLQGTQNALNFLPEQHTDFIFCVLAEEWGLMGSVAVLLLLFMLIAWGLNIAHGCRDPFGTILAVGVTAMVFWQAVINAGMVMGLMPVVGVPLPLVSYGGSSTVTLLLCVGLLMNVSMRRFLRD